MKLRELISNLMGILIDCQGEDLDVFIPGHGGSEGNSIHIETIEIKSLSPSQFISEFYRKKPEEAIEFDSDGRPDWVAKHGFKGVLIS